MSDTQIWIIRKMFSKRTNNVLDPNAVRYSNGALVFWIQGTTLKIAPPVDYEDLMDYAEQVIDILLDEFPELKL